MSRADYKALTPRGRTLLREWRALPDPKLHAVLAEAVEKVKTDPGQGPALARLLHWLVRAAPNLDGGRVTMTVAQLNDFRRHMAEHGHLGVNQAIASFAREVGVSTRTLYRRWEAPDNADVRDVVTVRREMIERVMAAQRAALKACAPAKPATASKTRGRRRPVRP